MKDIKDLNVLVLPLTSNKLYKLDRCYQSIKQQYPVSFKYTVKVVVNSLIDGYYKRVSDYFENAYPEDKIEVIETESNGKPGKGHNSQMEVFKKFKEYDYLFFIDGDDCFYPCAFQLYERLLKDAKEEQDGIDVICTMLNDKVKQADKESDLNVSHIQIVNDYYLTSLFDHQDNWRLKIDTANPFTTHMYKLATPSRLLIMSRNVFNKDIIPINYCEGCKLFDDYSAYIAVCENDLRKTLKVYNISSTYIYLYDDMNESNSTTNFLSNSINYVKESVIFKDSLKGKYLKTREWDFNKFTYKFIDNPKNYSTLKKREFCTNFFLKYELEEFFKEGNVLFNEQKYDDALKYYKRVMNFNANLQEAYLNSGFIYYQMGDDKNKNLGIVTWRRYLKLLDLLSLDCEDKDLMQFYINLILAYLDDEKNGLALFYCNKVIKLNNKMKEKDNIKIKDVKNIKRKLIENSIEEEEDKLEDDELLDNLHILDEKNIRKKCIFRK